MNYEETRPNFEETPQAQDRDGLHRLAVVVGSRQDERSAIERASLIRVAGDARIAPARTSEEVGADGRRGLALVPAGTEQQPGDEEVLYRPELVVTPRGPRDLRSRLFGSTAERLVRAADYPVLVTQLPARSPYARVLFATDFSPVAAEALRFASRMLGPDVKDAWVLHAYDTSYALVLRQVNASPERLLAYMAKAREEAEARMAEFLAPYQRQGRNLQPICRPGEPVDALRRWIRSVRAELLVVGKHALFGAGRPLLGTVAERSLRAAPCDVLVVPGRSPTIH
jgi:nucleotide-binding universal stress UspA family protein